MKLKLTHTIVVTQIIDTSPEAGYESPEDLESCVAEEQNWYDDGSISLEDMDFTSAIVTITGERV